MRASVFASISTLLAAFPANAQSTFVSPAGLAGQEGVDASSLPLLHNTPRRFLQIHSDLTIAAGSLKKLSFRRDAASPRGSGTRQIDCELHIGASLPYDQASFTFATNFLSTRTKVLARRLVSFPALASTTSPPAFELALPLDTSWPWPGRGSLAWDLAIHGAQTTGTYATELDTQVASTTTATSFQTGQGCYASGRTRPMSHTLQMYDAAGVLTIGGMVTDAPANAACLWMLGIANPSTVVPGLCSPLYSDMIVSVGVGVADTSGFLGAVGYGTPSPGGSFGFVFPNTAPGVTLFTQVHAIDFALPFPFKLANSDGRATKIPTSNPNRQVKVTRLYCDDGLPGAQNAIYIPDGNVGSGVVVLFSF